jgi:diguanylate cyclase (GGDEF)-like protein
MRLPVSPWRSFGRFSTHRFASRPAWSFAARLFVSLVVTIVVGRFAGYLYLSDHLQRDLLEAKASEQHANARSHARDANEYGHTKALAHIQELLDAFGAREGTVEAILIGPDYRIAAAARQDQVGELDRNAAVVAALRDGVEFEGYARHAGHSGQLYEFITPIVLPDGRRYALEVTQDDAFFQQQLGHLRTTMMVFAGISILLGSVLFWLAGGRSVIRSHRIALSRAMHDGLTGLGNHRAFAEELERAVALARRSGEPLSLVLVDLDSFKLVNDRHGHRYGDDILRRTAAAIELGGRVSDRGFRIGGDEFALLLSQTDARSAMRYAQRLHSTLRSQNITASIGVNELRPGIDAAEVLRQEADAALYEAKRRGDGIAVGFQEIRDHVSLASPEKVRAAHNLISDGDVAMALQPIWRVDGDGILGYEALARPAQKYGFSGPAEAFDLAVQLGKAQHLDRLCVERAFARVGELPADALLFVNIAPQTLDISAGRSGWVAELAAAAGVETDRVVVEVTERTTTRTTALVQALHELRADGFKLALDDAGTGNSGLEILREVHFDYVKIDRSVVNAAQTDNRARGVFFALVSYAGQTGARVIAEGIEDEQTFRFVQDAAEPASIASASIYGAQGYLLGRPSETLVEMSAA